MGPFATSQVQARYWLDPTGPAVVPLGWAGLPVIFKQSFDRKVISPCTYTRMFRFAAPPADLWLGTEWVLVRRSEAAAEPPGCLTGAETVLLDREHSEPPCEGRLSLCGSEECGLTPECRTPLEDAVGDDSFSQRLMRVCWLCV